MSDTKTQTRLRPVIRVFVSSTFSDMKHERNALAAEVYPRLEELCQKNGFQFQAIDLRWGVSSEAGLDHRTMRICFDELRRAQEISPEPNFLILLGNRYGWRPLPEAISAMEFVELATAATSGGEKQSPLPGAHGKTALQVLEEWYCCDENVVVPDPPETAPDRAAQNYTLQRRTQNLGDGRDYARRKDDPKTDTQDWMDVQQVLWRLVNAAFPAAGRWFDDVNWPQHVADVNDRQHPKRAVPQNARFQASATEQEIWCGALSAPNPERHVIACFREIANRDDFSAADAKEFFDVAEGGFDAASARRQADLKEAIKHRLGENKPLSIPFSRLKRENGKVLMDAPEADTQAFCDAVSEKFRPIIERQIEEYWNKSAQGSMERAGRELEIEQDEHKRFGRERGGKESFVGRESELEAIRDYLRNDSPRPLVVHGSSGCGKTALMWRALEEIPEIRKPIIRLIGTTPDSSDVRSLLGSLCQELRLRHPREGELPRDAKALREELHEQFRASTPEQPLILFLDALDQLSDADGGRLLNWIPEGPFPANMKLVVSCLSDRAEGDPAGQPWAELRRRQLPEGNYKNLDALSQDEARTLLYDRWLHQAGRTVSPEQRERIGQRLASPACRQPIYLKLLFEEARLWRSYDQARSPGRDVPKMLARFFVRLRQPGNHGRLLVNRVLGYLAASRHGLSENEILEILFDDHEYKTALDQVSKQTHHELPAGATRIPIAIWSRLRFDLAPYLTERAAVGANVLTFYHRQVAEWVRQYFTNASGQDWQPHQRLADYFHQIIDDLPATPQEELRPAMLPAARIRCHTELPWQLGKSNNWAGLSEYLIEDRLFVEAWLINAYEVKGYWTAIEANSEIGLADAYRHVIAYPAGKECSYPVGILLFEMGHYEEARQLFEAVVEVARNPQEYGFALHEVHEGETLRSVLGVLAALLRRLNRPDEAAKVYEECESLSRAAPDDVGLARALAGRANVLDYNGKYSEALALYEEAERLSRANRLDVTTLLLNQSSCLLSLRRTEEATARCEDALSTAKLQSDPELESHAQEGMADIFLKQGQPEKAMSLYRRVETAFRQVEDKPRLARVLCNQASIHFDAGHFNDALRLFVEAEATAAKLETTTNVLITARAGQAEILRSQGQFPRAMELYQQNERDCRKSKNPGELGKALGGRAAILLAAGELPGALRLLSEWEDICRAIGDEDGLQRAIGNKALVFLQRGNGDEAAMHLKEQESICERIGALESLARCWGNQAAVHSAASRFELAIALLLKQKQLLQESNARNELVACLHNLSSCYVQTGAFQAALDILDGHEIICRELGLWPQLVNSLAMQAVAYSAGTPVQPISAAKKAQEAMALARAHDCEAQVRHALISCEQIARMCPTNGQK